VVQAIVLFVSVVSIALSLLADLAYVAIDPRLRRTA
jgi:ABC-type dipeptide/oligopeptide/nickel transport system permease component